MLLPVLAGEREKERKFGFQNEPCLRHEGGFGGNVDSGIRVVGTKQAAGIKKTRAKTKCMN